jgi:hypothetical protein
LKRIQVLFLFWWTKNCYWPSLCRLAFGCLFFGYNSASHKLIVFKSVVWKKEDKSFQKNGVLGLEVGSNPGPQISDMTSNYQAS